jgi:hypothetical protein
MVISVHGVCKQNNRSGLRRFVCLAIRLDPGHRRAVISSRDKREALYSCSPAKPTMNEPHDELTDVGNWMEVLICMTDEVDLTRC